MNIRTLMGAGDRIMGCTLPFALLGVVLNVLHPEWFALHHAPAGRIAGGLLLLTGVPIWLTSVAQVALNAPRGRLITRGAFALVRHPLYTSVALLVVPGVGFVLDSWMGLAIGAILYSFSRLFAGREDRELAQRFPADYPRYRAAVLLPWL